MRVFLTSKSIGCYRKIDISNSAIGGWAELGNVNNAIIDHNVLAGGGAGCIRTHQTSGLWKALFGDGLPSVLTRISNTFDDGSTLTLDIAQSERGC